MAKKKTTKQTMGNKDLEKDDINALIRDITKVGFMAKSEARRRLGAMCQYWYEKGCRDALEAAASSVRSMKVVTVSERYLCPKERAQEMLEHFKDTLLSALLPPKNKRHD